MAITGLPIPIPAVNLAPGEPLIRRMSVKALRRKVNAGFRQKDAETIGRSKVSDPRVGHCLSRGILRTAV